jgi:hypothetical protein
MAVYAEQLAFMMNVLAPFLRINEERAYLSIDHNLGNVRLAMARKAFLVWV